MHGFTPELQLHTLFVLDGRGCIVSTRESSATPGPRFVLIRGATQCAWATRADLMTSSLDESIFWLVTGRFPIYSTSWTNGPSLAIARKLSLSLCASDWSLYD